jgi:hypothetical protein
VRYTQSKNGQTKYIFLFDYPEGKLELEKIQLTKGSKLQLLGSTTKIAWKEKEDRVEINLPANLKQVSNHVWVIRVSI